MLFQIQRLYIEHSECKRRHNRDSYLVPPEEKSRVLLLHQTWMTC